jgi:iron complex transport system substrate-binding protein
LRLPVTITDAGGREVTVTSAARIVSLSGGITETLLAMGLGGRIVGRDVTADVPEVRDVPLVTQGHDVSAEGVLALNPSLVLVDARTGPPEALDAIRAAGVPVVEVPEVWQLDEIGARVTAVATAVGAREAGLAVNHRIDRQLARLAEAVPDRPRVAFLYLRGSAAVYLIGGDGSGADSLIEAVGGIDAGSRAGLKDYTPLTPEALVEAAPDVILVMTKGLESVGGVAGLLELPGIAQTPAGRNRRIVAVPDGELLSFGPRTPQTLRRLADQLR